MNIPIEDEHIREAGDYFFKFQFFVHHASLSKDLYNVAKPAIAIRFLDFPTLIVHGKATQFALMS